MSWLIERCIDVSPGEAIDIAAINFTIKSRISYLLNRAILHRSVMACGTLFHSP